MSAKANEDSYRYADGGHLELVTAIFGHAPGFRTFKSATHVLCPNGRHYSVRSDADKSEANGVLRSTAPAVVYIGSRRVYGRVGATHTNDSTLTHPIVVLIFIPQPGLKWSYLVTENSVPGWAPANSNDEFIIDFFAEPETYALA